MPELTEFRGIRITMQYDDHNPPHFHVKSGSYKATYDFNGTLKAGYLPTREERLVLAWVELYREQLNDNWYRAERHEELCKMPGL